MYESHHQPEHTLSGNPLTDFDYQLMMDANAFTKCEQNNPNLADFNHPDYLALMQAHSLPLDPASSAMVQDDTLVGSDSSNSSNEQLYYHHHPSSSSMDLPQSSSSVTVAGYQISNTASPPHLSSASMYLASSAPSSIPHHTNIHMSSQQRDQSNDDSNPMASHIPTTSSLSSSSSTPSSSYQQTHPHHPSYYQHHLNSSYPPYQQVYQNTSDPSVYPSLDEYAPFYSSESYTGNHANSNAAIYEQFDSATSQYHHLEQFYGQPLDEQQQFFLMQQHQQRIWAEQQKQLSVPSSYSAPRSPTAYTTEADSRPQIYVRKACVACKQSHVACDVQRPCSRCVRLNKADSCVDAERKKRGRPCGSGKKKKEEEKEMRRREQQQQLHLLHHHHHTHHDPLIR